MSQHPFVNWLRRQGRKSIFNEPNAWKMFFGGSNPRNKVGMQFGRGTRKRQKGSLNFGKGTRRSSQYNKGYGFTRADAYVFGTDQPDRLKGLRMLGKGLWDIASGDYHIMGGRKTTYRGEGSGKNIGAEKKKQFIRETERLARHQRAMQLIMPGQYKAWQDYKQSLNDPYPKGAPGSGE